MIYLKDEKTGVWVEDVHMSYADGLELAISGGPFSNAEPTWVSSEQADALLRGLLRWKLETVGVQDTSALVHATIRDWMHHGAVKGGQ
jgi:hypothetical protein